MEVDLAADAWFLGVESLVFGRAAMGEQVAHGSLRDLIQVRRGGRLLLHDAIRLDGEVGRHLAAAGDRRRRARGGDAGARRAGCGSSAGVLCATRCSPHGGASAWDGMLIARILAADGAALRRAVVACAGGAAWWTAAAARMDVLRGQHA